MQFIMKILLAALSAITGSLSLRKSRTFRYLKRVHGWEFAAARAITEECGPCAFPVAALLAIVHVESSGNAKARRPGSQFYGLTQIGKAVAADIGLDDRRKLLGNGSLALRGFCQWAKKYRRLHGYDPELMAIAWKGGVGTLNRYNTRIARGDDPEAVAKWLDDDRWGTDYYRRKWIAAYSIWSSDDPSTASPVKVYK